MSWIWDRSDKSRTCRWSLTSMFGPVPFTLRTVREPDLFCQSDTSLLAADPVQISDYMWQYYCYRTANAIKFKSQKKMEWECGRFTVSMHKYVLPPDHGQLECIGECLICLKPRGIMYDLAKQNIPWSVTLHGSHLLSLTDVYLNMVPGACQAIQHLKVQLSPCLSALLRLFLSPSSA